MPTQRYPALVVITNTHKAVWLYAPSASQYSELQSFATPKAVFSDKEAYFKSGPKGSLYRTGTSLDLNREFDHETKEHLAAVAKKTAVAWRAGRYGQLFAAVPTHIKRQFEAECKKTLNPPPIFIAGNFIHRSSFRVLLNKIKTTRLVLAPTKPLKRRAPTAKKISLKYRAGAKRHGKL